MTTKLLPTLTLYLTSATLALLTLVTSCTYEHGEPSVVPCDASAANTKFAAVISPILQVNCRDGCHNTANFQNNGGYQNFDDFATVQRNALGGQLLGCIRHEAGYPPMPKGRAKLSDCDIARIAAWVGAGALNN